MKRLTIATIMLVMGRLCFAQSSVAIDPELRYQTVEGWGGSLSWWAFRVGGWATAAQVDTICNWITSATGLNMNVFRYAIGGGDDPAHNHMRFDAAIPGFKTSSGGAYDWTRDANQRKFLLALKTKRADCIFEATSYSPPYWMTNSGCTAGGTGGVENIKTTHYTAYADYLTEVVKKLQHPLWSSVQNTRTIERTGSGLACQWSAGRHLCKLGPPDIADQRLQKPDHFKRFERAARGQ